MNCKPGDLAVVARATNGDVVPYLGRVVTCLRVVHGDCWATDPELEAGRAIYDGALRPIRDQDGEDEMLTLAGKPNEVKETA